MKKRNHILIHRELSWLSFSERILQEAKDPRVPVYERLRFLAIFSSNLDEYFRVRIASLRSLLHLRKKMKKKLDVDPAELLKQVKTIVENQQEEFGRIFRKQLLPELRSHNIFLVRQDELSPSGEQFGKTKAYDIIEKDDVGAGSIMWDDHKPWQGLTRDLDNRISVDLGVRITSGWRFMRSAG